MQLNEINRDGKFRVLRMNSDIDSIARLMDMGLLPGEEIRLMHEAPLGDPIAIEFRDCHMSLRLKDAAHVEVEMLEQS